MCSVSSAAAHNCINEHAHVHPHRCVACLHAACATARSPWLPLSLLTSRILIPRILATPTPLYTQRHPTLLKSPTAWQCSSTQAHTTRTHTHLYSTPTAWQCSNTRSTAHMMPAASRSV